VECLIGDNHKRDMDSYNRYLKDFEDELQRLVKDRDESARELTCAYDKQVQA